MKKLVAVIASVLLALTICLTAAADTAAEVLYDKAADESPRPCSSLDSRIRRYKTITSAINLIIFANFD